MIKKKRTALQSAFTDDDAPGALMKKCFQQVMEKLHFPEGEQREHAKVRK